jgi:GntR family transcriptional regulator
MPLWAQVLEDLRERLRGGEFAVRFPSDVELVESYGVSRQTVREAVRRLQHEGLIERARGRGSFVSRRPLEAPLGTLYSLFRAAEAQGFVQESIVRYLEKRTDELAATMLGCKLRASLVYLERLRLVDGEPVVLDCSWLPFSLAAPLLTLPSTRSLRSDAVCAQIRVGSNWSQHCRHRSKASSCA